MSISDQEMHLHGALSTAEGGTNPYAIQIKIPTLVFQVHDDSWMPYQEIEKFFDLLGSKEKELL